MTQDVTLTLTRESSRALLAALRASGDDDQVDWYTLQEAARALKVSDQTIRNRIKRGEIPGVRRVGRQYRIPAGEIQF